MKALDSLPSSAVDEPDKLQDFIYAAVDARVGEYVTVLEWGISAPLNWYSHAILKNTIFSNTST